MISIIGPEHMRKFAEDANTIETFKKAALNLTAFISGYYCYYVILSYNHACINIIKILFIDSSSVKPATTPVIILPSRDPEDYRNDVLAKYIPAILNPKGIY